jgi:hypothetical protein
MACSVCPFPDGKKGVGVDVDSDMVVSVLLICLDMPSG